MREKTPRQLPEPPSPTSVWHALDIQLAVKTWSPCHPGGLTSRT